MVGQTMLSATPASDTQQIWSDFGHRLRAFIARRVDNPADAEDILQDVFLRIHRHAGAVERSERLVSWLFQVTRNAIVDYYRSPERRRELLSGANFDVQDGPPEAIRAITENDSESPATWLELAACLGPMVARLPSPYREAVTLVDLKGLPHKEAADRSGLSVSGMKSRVQRGRLALKDLLHDCCQIERDAGGHVSDYQPRGSGCGPCANGCG